MGKPVRWAFGAAAKWSLLIKRPVRLVGASSTHKEKVFIITTTEEV